MEEKEVWYLNPIVVLILLFLVLGPFAFPLLYRSRGFSSGMKLILTVVVLLYVGYLIYASFKIGLAWESKF